MNNITKTNKMGLVAVFIAASLFVGTFAVLSGHDMAYAKSRVKINDLSQGIFQPQQSSQSSQCITGLVSALNCNNAAAQLAFNFGSLAAGQR
jgi:hypothetical protein